jgi:hypothetical protein
MKHEKYTVPICSLGNEVAKLDEALCHKPKDRCSIPDDVITFIVNVPNPSSRTIAVGLIQSPTEMSARNLPGG